MLEPTQSLHTLVRGRAAFCLSLRPGLTLLGAEEEALCLPACSPRLATRDPQKLCHWPCVWVFAHVRGWRLGNGTVWPGRHAGEWSSELVRGREGLPEAAEQPQPTASSQAPASVLFEEHHAHTETVHFHQVWV